MITALVVLGSLSSYASVNIQNNFQSKLTTHEKNFKAKSKKLDYLQVLTDGHFEILRKHLNSGQLYIEQRFTDQKITLLMAAVSLNQFDFAKELIEKYKAKVNILDNDQKDVVSYINTKNIKFFRYLFSKALSPKENHLPYLLTQGTKNEIDLVDRYKSEGVLDLDSPQIFYSACNADSTIFEHLVKSGADVHLTYGGENFLSLATSCNNHDPEKFISVNVNIINRLIELEVNPSYSLESPTIENLIKNGSTSWTEEGYGGPFGGEPFNEKLFLPIIRKLLQRVNPNHKNAYGLTPYMVLAVRAKRTLYGCSAARLMPSYESLIKLLKEYGADETITFPSGSDKDLQNLTVQGILSDTDSCGMPEAKKLVLSYFGI